MEALHVKRSYISVKSYRDAFTLHEAMGAMGEYLSEMDHF